VFELAVLFTFCYFLSAIHRCTNGEQDGSAINRHGTIARWRTALALSATTTTRLGFKGGVIMTKSKL
jgi:hypothetical protein